MYFFRVKLGLNGEPLQGPYLDKLAHIQVVINCQYSIAQIMVNTYRYISQHIH